MDNKEKLNNLSTADWIKIGLVIALALFLVHRCFLPFRAEYAFREAFNAKARKNIPLAIEKYRKAIKLAPWETHYAVQLGKIYEDLARAEKEYQTKKLQFIMEAEDIYTSCLLISPQNPWYHNRLGEVYNLYASVAKTPEEKLEWQKKREEKIILASQLDKNNALFQMSVAYHYHRLKKYDKALEKYKHVLVIDDRFAEAYFNMADIYRIRGEEEKQIEMYLNIFEKKPAFKNAHLQLGRIYERKKMYKEALQQYIAEAKLNKQNAVAYQLVGSLAYRLKDWENTAAAYRRLTVLKPDNLNYYLAHAKAAAAIGKLDEAIESLETAKLLKPDDTKISESLNNLKKAKGK